MTVKDSCTTNYNTKQNKITANQYGKGTHGVFTKVDNILGHRNCTQIEKITLAMAQQIDN